jgi:predicted ATPase
MLERIITTNYRNLKMDSEQGVKLKNLNIFVGPNGAGKSNLVRLLRFFSDASNGTNDEVRRITAFEQAIYDLGSGRILDSKLKPPSEVSLRLYFDSGEEFSPNFNLNIGITDENTTTIKSQQLLADKYGVYVLEPTIDEQKEKDIDITKIYDTHYFYRMQSKKNFMFSTYLSNDNFVNNVSQVNNWAFYSASEMDVKATQTGLGEIRLSATGENLALVLQTLTKNSLSFEERLNEAMKELFPKTKKLRVVLEGRSTLLMQWFIGESDRPFYLDEMSDGTVRMLCWASILLTPDPPALIVIDEPEGGVHPAWLQILAGWIREASRKTQVIVSTHSSDLLDYFTDDLECVQVFKMDKDGYSTIEQLSRERLKEPLDAGWKLGDLYRIADPQVGGWPW